MFFHFLPPDLLALLTEPIVNESHLIPWCTLSVTIKIYYKPHQITKLKWFSSHLAAVFAQSTEARCYVMSHIPLSQQCLSCIFRVGIYQHCVCRWSGTWCQIICRHNVDYMTYNFLHTFPGIPTHQTTLFKMITRNSAACYVLTRLPKWVSFIRLCWIILQQQWGSGRN